MNEDNRKKVYDVLKSQTGYQDSYDDFNKLFDADDQAKKKVFDVLASQTGYQDSYDDFTRLMGGGNSSDGGFDAVGRMKQLIGQNKAVEQPKTLRDMVREKQVSGEQENKAPVAGYAAMIRSEQYGYKPSVQEPVKMDLAKRDEERRIDSFFKPKEVAAEADILDNYRARFSNTERGLALDKERSQIQEEIAGSYLDEFKQSPEYKELTGKQYSTQEEANAANRKLSELFEAKYGEAIEKDMLPYNEAMTDEMIARYGQRIKDDMLQLNKKNTKQQVGELVDNVDKLLEDNHKKLKQRSGNNHNAMNALMNSANYNAESASDRKEKGVLQAAKKLLEQSQNIIDEAGKKGKTNFFAGLGRGLYDNTTWDNYTFGLAELADGKRLLSALEKAERGEELTEAEEALLSASAVNMATQAYFSRDLGRGYKAGETTAVSIPFMLEFVANPISSSGNAIAKGLLKHGLKKFGSAATTKGAKAAGRLIGDATAAAGMTATTSAPRVAAGALNRMAGNYKYSLDKDGNMMLEKEGDLSMGGALMKSAASTFFENQSEMIFNAFRPANKVMKAVEQSLPGGVDEFMKRVQHSGIGKLYHDMKTNPAFVEAAKRAQFHGIGEEYLEEVYNNFANVAMREMTMNELTDLDNNINTFLGLAPTQIVFSAIGLGGLAAERYSTRRKLNRLYEQASEEQKARMDELRSMSHENGNQDIAEFIKTTLADESLSQEEKRNEIDYAYNLAKGIAMEEIQEDDIQDEIKAETEDITSRTDPSTGIYTEMNRLSMDEVGNTISIPGHKTGEINGANVWIQEGVENIPENRITLKPEEIDQSSIRSMPANEVVAVTEQVIRQKAKAKAEKEARFSPEIEEPVLGITFEAAGKRYQLTQQNPDGGWLAQIESGNDKPVVEPITNEQYYELRQAEIDANEEAEIQVKHKETNVPENTESVLKNAENVPENAENVPENAENVQNSPISAPKSEDNADLMPLTKDGEPDFYASSPQRSHKYIYEESGLDRNEANEFVQLRLDAANKTLEKVKKSSQPKMGTSIMKYKQAKEQHQKLVDDAQKSVDYWKAVRAKQAEISKAEREEMAQKEAALRAEAVEQANAEREAQRIAEEERAAVGNENPMPAITEKWAKANKVDGIQDEIVLPNGERIKGHYVLHESGASSASHQATNGFRKTDGFPMDEAGNTVNDRDYEGDKEAQDVTRGIASKYDQRALQTPVVVSRDGVVLSGNGRTMAGELAALDGTDSAYNEYLKNYSSKFGFSPEQVSQMQHPRVAFVPDERMPYTAETFAKFNQQDMKAQNKTEQAVKLGKTVSDEVLAGILRTMNAYDTLGDFYNDASVSSQIVNMLVRDNVVPQAQVAEMYDGNKLSVVGREMLENILVGKSFEGTPDIVRMLTGIPSMRQSVLFALSEISNNLMLGSDYALKNEIAEAIKLCYEARNKGGVQFGEDVTSYARQLHLFADGLQTVADYHNATIMMLAKAINDKRVSQLKKVLASYNGMAMDSATGQLDLFTGELKERTDIINDVLNLLNNGTEQQINAAGQAAAEKRKESATAVSENGAFGQSDGAGAANERGGKSVSQSQELGKRERGNGIRLTQQQIDTLIDQMNNNAEESYEKELTPQTWAETFDEKNKIKTPLGLVKMGDGQISKFFEKNRTKEFGMVGPTLANPDIIIAEPSEAKDGNSERDSSFLFIKTFKRNGETIKYYASITVKQDGMEVSISSHYMNKNKVKKAMNEVVLYIREALLSNSSEWRLAEHQDDVPDLLPTQEGNASESKDSKTSLNTSGTGENNHLSITENKSKPTEAEVAERPTVQAQIESAEAETNTDPTEAQKKAGNYKMGHVQIGNFDISIENPAGSERKGVDANGKPWSTKMANTYGYMRGTEGVDGDHIDVFLANDMDAWNGRKVFVVDQYNEDGTFDEHKVMLGFNEQEDAEAAYFANYDKDWGKKHKTVVTAVNLEDFEKWVDSSHRKTKAFAEYKSINGRANNPSEPIVKAGTIFKNNEAGGDAVAVVVGSEVKNGERRYMVSFAPDKESAEAKLFFGDKWMSESELQQWLDDGRFAEYKGVKVIRTDHQGNPVNADGSLLLEKIGSIDELTDGDFLNASRSVQLPALPEKVDEVIGANGKPVVIKKNIFEKNRKSHKDVSPAQSRDILLEALYKPTMYGQNQKTKRPYNWILIHNAVKHSSVELEVNHNKDNVEVVNWHYLEDDTLEQKKRQAINEGGLILTLESAAGNTINGLSSENKDTEFVSEKQADGDKSSETNTPIVPRMDGYTIESRKDTRDNSDLFAVKFDERVSRDEFKGQKEIAKQFGGYWSNFGKKGFLFKTEEAAHDFAETVMGRSVEEVEDEAPISIASITKKNDPNAAEYRGDTYFIGDEVILNGVRGRIIAINRWKSPVVQTEHATIAMKYNGTDDLIHYVESEEETPNNKTNDVSKPEDPYHTDAERAHYEELKKRMRAKLNQLNSGIDPELLEIGVEMAFFHFKGGMRHFADFCKTMIEDCGDKIRPHLKMLYNAAAGTEDFIARGWDEEMDDRKTVRDFDVYNFDKATVDVIETAQHVVEEAESMQQGEQIVEQIKNERNEEKRIERKQEEADTAALASEAETVASEAEATASSAAVAATESGPIEEHFGFKIGDAVFYTPFGKKTAQKATIHDFEKVGGKPVLDTGLAPVMYELVEWSQVAPIESEESKKMDTAPLEEAARKVDEQLEKVNKRLALLGYYEAEAVEKDYNEAYGYMRNAEKKAVKDAKSLFDKLVKDLGLEDIVASKKSASKGKKSNKQFVYSNIAPIGGDICMNIPLNDDVELSVYFHLDAVDGDNLKLSGVMYRIEQGGKSRSNNFINSDATYNEMLRAFRYVSKKWLPLEDLVSMAGRIAQEADSKKEVKNKKGKITQQSVIGDLFGDLNTNDESKNNEQEVQLQPGSSATKREGGHQPGQNEPVGKSKQHEAERADGRRMGGRDSSHSVSDEKRSGSLSDIHKSERSVESKPKNVHNNVAERGRDYAPKGERARVEANIKAIETMNRLLEDGKSATRDDMELLRRFSGWGGLGGAFKERIGDRWSAENPINKKLREIMTPEQYEWASGSASASQYFTPAFTIDAMWDIARAMGFKGGNVLEGSAGIGNILGLMPRDLSAKSNIMAVEKDDAVGQMLSLLYPDAKVEVKGFEEAKIENGSVDLAITNVPFVTGLKVFDTSGDNDLSRKFRDIHNFCIAKNIRKLREGGIGIFISSSGTMDRSPKLMNWITNEGKSDVVGAFRLHSNTFGGTNATSDIIVVRKRVNGRKSANAIDVSKSGVLRVVPYTPSDARSNAKPKDMALDMNQYFIDHPENMGGEMAFAFEKGETYQETSRRLYPSTDIDQERRLSSWANTFKSMDWEASAKQINNQEDTSVVYEDLGEGVKEGTMLLDKNGELCLAQRGKAVPIGVNKNKVKGKTKAECFHDYKSIKDALAKVLDYQTNHEDDKGLAHLLKELNRVYDNFVNTYGHLNKNRSIPFLRKDIDFPSIAALENVTEKGRKDGTKEISYSKTDVFQHRVVDKESMPKPQNVKDGIIASIYLHGRVDVPYISEQLGLEQEKVREDIIESGLGFENPTTMDIEVSYEYLSGNVREKLNQAREANADGRYDVNIKALEAVVPMNIPAHLIQFSLGSSWVTPKLYTDYIQERTDLNVSLTNAGGTWVMTKPYSVNNEKNKALGVHSEICNKIVYGHELIEAALQNRTISVTKVIKHYNGETETIVDKDATMACANKIDEIRQDFRDWARQKMQRDTELSQEIERVYNEQFNNFVPKEIHDEFIPVHFGGAASIVNGARFSLRKHQAKAAIRATTQPLMLAHEVGTGKTFTLITTAMEMRRLGTAHKPMIVVQNATVGQFVGSAKSLYPNARILTLEDADRAVEGRKNFYAKIRYNDWDMIVVPQSVFERIPDSPEREARFIQDKIEEKMRVIEQLREASDGRDPMVRRAEKELENLKDELNNVRLKLSSPKASGEKDSRDKKREAKAKQNAAVKAQEMLDRETDDTMNFDDMGIDALLIDEAHEYKHLGFETAMQRGVKGVDPSYSKKSQGVYLKTQAVLENNNGRNVVFATGTPISNTAAEIWTFMRYLMPADVMKSYDIFYFDDFVRNFGQIEQIPEFGASGKYKEVNRFNGYTNLPELERIWLGVADTVLTKQAGGVSDKIPSMEGDKAKDVYLPQTKALRSVMKYVKNQLEAFEQMSGKEKKEHSHIPLVMYGIAKAAAVDARLVLNDAADEANSKTNETVRQTLKSLEDSKDYHGTVAIFADNYQNKQSGFNLYEDVRDKLIDKGVPEEQIVIMRSGMTVKKKLEIFDKVNRGEVRVIMGSTFTLGTGVNIQERLHTLIHVDAPVRPMDYTQRNGRILRQGNLHKEWGIPVRVLRFGVEDSLDVTAYQRLKTKGAIADSIMNGKQLIADSMNNRVLEEEQDVFGDITAQLSGSEYALLKNQIEKQVKKLESRRSQWEQDQMYIHNQKPRLKGMMLSAQERKSNAESYLKKVEGIDDKTIHVGKLLFKNVDAMADYIKDYNSKQREVQERIRSSRDDRHASKLVVTIGGFEFTIDSETTKEVKQSAAGMVSSASTKMRYTCEELGLVDVPVDGQKLKNAINDILDDVLSGNDFREIIETSSTAIQRYEEGIKQLEAREGKPFEDAEALEQAKAKLEEYDELMKKELEEKEAKYAEMDSEVEEAKDVVPVEEEEEEEEDEDLYRVSEEIESLFKAVMNDELTGDPIPIGKLTSAGREYLESISGLSIKKNVDFMLNPSDLKHIYNDHFGKNEKDKGKNIPLNMYDIRRIVDVISFPDRIIYGVEKESGRKLFYFFLDSPSGTYNLLEVYANKKGNLTAKTYYKTKKDAAQRVVELNKTLLPTSETYSGAILSNAKIPQMFDIPTFMDENLRTGDGSYSDELLSYENDPIAKWLGESKRSKNQQQEYAQRVRERMVKRAKELADLLHLDNVEIVTDTSTLEGRKARAKGWFSKSTGKIVVLIPNNKSVADMEQTILHEAVVHYGLRRLFGKHFDEFLMNVYNNAEPEVRNRIVELAKNKGWKIDEAIEEYLASLAEDTNFEDAVHQGWFDRIKLFFIRMLAKAGVKLGVELGDNELRYILWRSYENLAEPGRYRSIISEAEDIYQQYKLKVGNYTEGSPRQDAAAEDLFRNNEMDAALAESLNEMKRFVKRDIGIYGVGTFEDIENLPFDKWVQWELMDKLNNPECKGTHYRGSIFIFPSHAESIEDLRMSLWHEIAHSASYGLGLKQEFKAACLDYLDVKLPDVYDNIVRSYHRSKWEEEAVAYLFEKTLEQYGVEKLFSSKFVGRETISTVFREIIKYLKDGTGEYNRFRQTPLGSRSASEIHKGSGTAERNDSNDSFDGRRNSGSQEVRSSKAQRAGSGESDVLFRDGDGKGDKKRQVVSDGTREAYETAVTGNKFRAQEGFQDSMLSLKRLQDVIEKNTGKIKSFENAYMAENQMSSKNTAECEKYGKNFFKPMMDEVVKLVNQGASYENIVRYLYAKHGLERNEYMRHRAAEQAALEELGPKPDAPLSYDDEKFEEKAKAVGEWNEAFNDAVLLYESEEKKDYSGLSSLTEDEKDFEEKARQMVDEFEGRFSTDALWKKVNAATKETLRKTYESGLIGRDTYLKISKQYKNYIPLRGWDETTADEVYEYMQSEMSPLNSSLKTAKGRKSMADDPLATIGNMAESAILEGNRNLMKQNLLNLALNHPTHVLTVRKSWYVQNPVTGDWELSVPDIKEGDSADVIADKIEAHETRMREMQDKGLAVKGKNNLRIDYRSLKNQQREHTVVVKRNGEDYILYVNGNPRAAQAVNGLTNPNREENKLLTGISQLNRWMAANFTTRNPAFVFSNLSRDLILSVSAVAVKEDRVYTKKFAKNIPAAMRIIARNLAGKGDPTNAEDRMFEEFLMNGGETGYTALHNVDEYKKMIKDILKDEAITGESRTLEKGFKASLAFFSTMNRWAEDVSRFAAYKTSREMGRTVTESVHDAKEITVNFNKKGSGLKAGGLIGAGAWAGRGLYLFFNAAVQSLVNFGRLAKKNRKGFLTLLGGFFTAGALTPLLNQALIQLLGGDGDDDYYNNLPEWVRRNNLCIYAGAGKFVTIPLPIELRAFYGLGEMAYQELCGHTHNSGREIASKAINQISELLPLNPLGNDGDIVSNFMPDIAKPFWQLNQNRDFTGKPIYKKSSFNETKPEWTKAYKSTSPVLVSLAEWTNELGGGDKHKRAWGIMNWNPAKVEHVLEGCFGGMAKTINQTAGVLVNGTLSAMDGQWSEHFSWASTPVLNRFVSSGSDDRSSYAAINRRFYDLQNKFKEIEDVLSGYKKEAMKGDTKYRDKLNELLRSEDFRTYQIFKQSSRGLKKLNEIEKMLPDSSDDERDALQKLAAQERRKIVELIDGIE